MSVADISAWSQVVASIAVLLTLVYLTIQVRQSADLTRAAIISTQKINHAYDRILKDRQSAEETASTAGDAA